MNYYIADCHFGHSAILCFDNRPFSDVEEMEEVMVTNWNAVVNPKDTVYVLGDFCWGKVDEWARILRHLKGKKVLIKGNHDLKRYPPELCKQFVDITEYKEVADNGRSGNESRKVILSHYPIPFYKHSNNSKYYMLCGHVHTTAENDQLERLIRELRENYRSDVCVHVANCGQIYNVGCMMPWMKYTPRTLDEIIKLRGEYHNEGVASQK